MKILDLKILSHILEISSSEKAAGILGMPRKSFKFFFCFWFFCWRTLGKPRLPWREVKRADALSFQAKNLLKKLRCIEFSWEKTEFFYENLTEFFWKANWVFSKKWKKKPAICTIVLPPFENGNPRASLLKCIPLVKNWLRSKKIVWSLVVWKAYIVCEATTTPS